MEEINSLDWEKEATQDVVKEAKNRQKRYEQNTEQRLFLAKWVVWTSSIWLVSVIAILILVGATVLYLSPSRFKRLTCHYNRKRLGSCLYRPKRVVWKINKNPCNIKKYLYFCINDSIANDYRFVDSGG